MAPDASCYIIAEAGVNHNGSEERALAMVDAAAAAGADAVKFQTFRAELLVSRGAPTAAYQRQRTGAADQYSMLKALELGEDGQRRLARHCRQRGIEFLSTPFDQESAEFLVSIGCRRLKIPSGELTNLPLLARLAEHDLPLILSTGMATIAEVETAVERIRLAREQLGYPRPLPEMLTLLHCTSKYPAALADVNLRAMTTLADAFRLPVGYSDHTLGTAVAPLAVALGAVVFEKHFTLDRDLDGPDHAASLEPDELATMVRSIREAELILGSAEKRPTGDEMEIRTAARRSVTLATDVPAGVSLTRDMITLLRPGGGIQPAEMDAVIGRPLRRSMRAGETLHHEDLEA